MGLQQQAPKETSMEQRLMMAAASREQRLDSIVGQPPEPPQPPQGQSATSLTRAFQNCQNDQELSWHLSKIDTTHICMSTCKDAG